MFRHVVTDCFTFNIGSVFVFLLHRKDLFNLRIILTTKIEVQGNHIFMSINTLSRPYGIKL